VRVAALAASGPIVTGLAVPRTGHTGRPIRLTGSATPWAHPLASEPRWDFGDGRVAVGANAMVEYPRPGRYTVTLTQTDAGGGATKATRTIEITAPPQPLQVAVGRGIGAVRLGTTRAAVVRAYGAPMAEAFARYPNRRPGRVLRYPRPNGTLIVGFHAGRVVLVATSSPSDRTAGNVGPGSRPSAAATLPGFRRSPSGYARRANGTLTVFQVGATRTVRRVSIAKAGFARA
jgi:PKD domain